ncbi:MAG TPA: hypothetical protein VEO19_04040 [Terriglobia bacterium]|nr:hypothetical protein [Terriglobia bacterium]
MTISVKELLDAIGGKLSEDAVRRLTGRLGHLSPAAVLSLANQAAIRITGDGDAVGSNNRVFVLKGEGLQELARLFARRHKEDKPCISFLRRREILRGARRNSKS